MSNPYEYNWVEVAPGVTMPAELAPQGPQFQPHPGAELPAMPIEQPEQAPFGAPPDLGAPQLTPPAPPWETAPVQAQPEQPFLPPGVDQRKVKVSGSIQTGPSVVRGSKMNLSALQDMNNAAGMMLVDSYDQADEANTQMAQAKMAEAEGMQPLYDQRTAQIEQSRQEEAERHAKAQQVLVEHEARVQQAIMNVPNEDPGRYWNNLGGFGQAVAAITMMLGGIQGAANGTNVNQPVQLALQLIDRDLASQRTNIQTAKDKVGFAQDAYGRAKDRNYYDKLAAQEQRAMMLETIASAIEAKGQSYKSQYTQAEHAQLAAGIRIKRDETLVQLSKDLVAQTMQGLQLNNQVDQFAAQMAQRRMEFAAEQEERKFNRALKVAELEGKQGGHVVNPSTGFSVNGKEVVVATGDQTYDRERSKVLQTQGLAAGRAYRALERLSKMDINRLRGLDPTKRSALMQDAADAVLNLSTAAGEKLGKLTDRDMAMLKHAAGVGNVEQMFALVGNAGIQERMKQSMGDIKEHMNRLGNADRRVGDDNVEWSPFAVVDETAPASITGAFDAIIVLDGVKEHGPGNVRALLGASTTLAQEAKAGELSTLDAGAAARKLLDHSIKLRDDGKVGEARELFETGSFLVDYIEKRQREDINRIKRNQAAEFERQLPPPSLTRTPPQY